MTSYLTLYRGETVDTAKIVAVTADPQMIAEFAARLLQQKNTAGRQADPVLSALNQGKRRALRLVKTEASQ